MSGSFSILIEPRYMESLAHESSFHLHFQCCLWLLACDPFSCIVSILKTCFDLIDVLNSFPLCNECDDFFLKLAELAMGSPCLRTTLVLSSQHAYLTKSMGNTMKEARREIKLKHPINHNSNLIWHLCAESAAYCQIMLQFVASGNHCCFHWWCGELGNDGMGLDWNGMKVRATISFQKGKWFIILEQNMIRTDTEIATI